MDSLQQTRQAGATTELDITPAMIDAGLAAYGDLAWHDSRSEGSPREIVTAILLRGISGERDFRPRPKTP